MNDAAAVALTFVLVGMMTPTHAFSEDEFKRPVVSDISDVAPLDAADPVLLKLTDRERAILDRGFYSPATYASSGLVGTIVGLGTGHALQDRYKQTGWIYTVGEGLGIATIITGFTACGKSRRNRSDDSNFNLSGVSCRGITVGVGAIVLTGFKLAEILDVWIYPAVHNRRHQKVEARKQSLSWAPYVVPTSEGGAAFGLAFRY